MAAWRPGPARRRRLPALAAGHFGAVSVSGGGGDVSSSLTAGRRTVEAGALAFRPRSSSGPGEDRAGGGLGAIWAPASGRVRQQDDAVSAGAGTAVWLGDLAR